MAKFSHGDLVVSLDLWSNGGFYFGVKRFDFGANFSPKWWRLLFVNSVNMTWIIAGPFDFCWYKN